MAPDIEKRFLPAEAMSFAHAKIDRLFATLVAISIGFFGYHAGVHRASGVNRETLGTSSNLVACGLVAANR